jgi:predicted enzyme related to lactoylglutathione lyase
MNKNKVVHFEIVAIEPQRAIDFYTKVFDWEFKKWEGGEIDYWMVLTVPQNTPGAINGGLRKEMGTDTKERTKSVNAFVSIISVESIDDILEKIEKNGGEIMQPKMKIEKMGWLAYCLDSEGNMFGMMQPEM